MKTILYIFIICFLNLAPFVAVGQTYVLRAIFVSGGNSVSSSASYANKINFGSPMSVEASSASYRIGGGAWNLLTDVHRNLLEQLPAEYRLHQNYPNPFNPATVIRFDLPANAKVNLKVYDVIGREVATLVDNREYEAGAQEIILNAGGFASGVYFYRISIQSTVKSYTDVKKMLLLK